VITVGLAGPGKVSHAGQTISISHLQWHSASRQRDGSGHKSVIKDWPRLWLLYHATVPKWICVAHH